MLKITPLELWQEITRARALADKVNASRMKMVQLYAGEHFRSDWTPSGPKIIDNRFDEWLRMIMPQIVFDNPKVRVTTNRSGVHQAIPLAMQAAINWWAPQVRLYRTLTDVAYDAAFTYGVAMTTHGPRPGGDKYRSDRDTQALQGLPRVERIDPCRWFCDQAADRYDPANGHGRLAGHMFRADRDDLLADKRFNAKVVEACSEGDSSNSYGGEKSERKEIYAFEVWVPEIKTGDDPLATGTIYTIGLSQDMEAGKNAQWLRDPRPYIGPSCGPYTLFGFGIVPGSPYPYSPFASSYEQVMMLNQHRQGEHVSASRKKRFGLVEADNTQAATTLRKVQDGDVATMRDMKNAFLEVTLGGVTEDQMAYTNRLAEQVDRSLNLSETARGNVRVDTSATAIADAASQRSARLASMKRLMVEGTVQVLQTAAWHLYNHEDAAFHLPPDVAEMFIPRPAGLPDVSQADVLALQVGVSVPEMRKILEYQPEVIYTGGESEEPISQHLDDDGKAVFAVSPNTPGSRFEDFELEIEPYSMERVDEAILQRRSMQVYQVITQSLPLIMQFPQCQWEYLLNMIGEPLNIPNLAEKSIGKAWLSQIRQATQQQTAMAGAQPGMDPNAPIGGGIQPPSPTAGDGADGMSGKIGESVYGGGNLARAAAV